MRKGWTPQMNREFWRLLGYGCKPCWISIKPTRAGMSLVRRWFDGKETRIKPTRAGMSRKSKGCCYA